MSETEDEYEIGYQRNSSLYTQSRLSRAGFWIKNHSGDTMFASGLAVMGIALALIFATGGTAGVVGLFLILVASFLLCGKAIYPESGNEGPSIEM